MWNGRKGIIVLIRLRTTNAMKYEHTLTHSINCHFIVLSIDNIVLTVPFHTNSMLHIPQNVCVHFKCLLLPVSISIRWTKKKCFFFFHSHPRRNSWFCFFSLYLLWFVFHFHFKSPEFLFGCSVRNLWKSDTKVCSFCIVCILTERALCHPLQF